MDVRTFAREVEDAADCFSWGPSVLRKWLQAGTTQAVFALGLAELADGRSVDCAREAMRPFAGSRPSDLRVYDVAVQLVLEGATPNAIRAGLKQAAEREASGALEAA